MSLKKYSRFITGRRASGYTPQSAIRAGGLTVGRTLRID
jgi:hypothetical protein